MQLTATHCNTLHRCMLLSDGRIYTVGSCRLAHAPSGGGGVACKPEKLSFLECIRISESDVAFARTVNSLPHLDLASLVEGGECGGGEVDGGQMPCLGDVTCMTLVRDEQEPLKNVVLTGSLEGWVHCWSHGHLQHTATH